MALMMGSLYEALKEGGTSDERAKAATEEVAGYERRLDDLRTEMVERFGKVDAQLRLHSWMLTFVAAMVAAMLLRTFWP